MPESRPRTRKAAATSRAKQPQDRLPSLRDQLARKRAKVVTEHFPLGEEGEEAVSELGRLRHQLGMAELIAIKNGDKDGVLDELRKKITAAEKVRDEHSLILRFRGLSEDERDALVSEYAGDDIPDDADEATKDEISKANREKLKAWTYVAMEACVQDSDLTADDWREELSSDRWNAGDLLRIRLAINAAQGATPADGIPKD